MAQTSAEVARSLWLTGPVDLVAAFRDLDFPIPLLEALQPDTEIRFRPVVPGAEEPNFRGVEGLAEGWRDWLEPYEEYWLEVEDFVDAGGETVYMPARVHAFTRRDGVLIEHEPAAVCTFDGESVVRLAFYLDRVEAKKDAGLASQ